MLARLVGKLQQYLPKAVHGCERTPALRAGVIPRAFWSLSRSNVVAGTLLDPPLYNRLNSKSFKSPFTKRFAALLTYRHDSKKSRHALTERKGLV
jgi:hypothetical protein